MPKAIYAHMQPGRSDRPGFVFYFRIYKMISQWNTIWKKDVSIMEKFVPRKQEKEVISMRIASETLRELDRKSAEFEISRNELINQCIRFALANMEKRTEEETP